MGSYKLFLRRWTAIKVITRLSTILETAWGFLSGSSPQSWPESGLIGPHLADDFHGQSGMNKGTRGPHCE